MRLANSIRVMVFSKEDENKEEILKGLLGMFPFDLNENKIKVVTTNAEGFSDRKIQIMEVKIAKENLIRRFLENMAEKLGEQQVKVLLEQKESRLDQNLDFFIRFEKDYWIGHRKLALTDSGKCYHLRISLAAFPKKREVAMEVIDKMLVIK